MIEPRACCFCDMEKATEGRIPGCTRPPTRKLRHVMFGRPAILDVCEFHFGKAPEEDKPNKFIGPVVDGVGAESAPARRAMMEHLKRESVIELSCKGCGATLVRYHENEGHALSAAVEALGLDFLVIRDHLDHCDFRRTK